VRRPSNDSLLSMAALLLSLCAVVTTVWQTSIMREQLRLSVWPRVRVDFRYRTDNDERFFHFQLENAGVGPAILEQVSYSYRGQPYDSLGAVWDKVMEERGLPMAQIRHNELQTVGSGLILAPQEKVMMMLMKGGTPSTAEIMRQATPHLRISIRYLSIYGELWETGFPDRSSRWIGSTDQLP
jgi:hypothetical protein